MNVIYIERRFLSRRGPIEWLFDLVLGSDSRVWRSEWRKVPLRWLPVGDVPRTIREDMLGEFTAWHA